MKKRAVVTGMGVVSPIGIGKDENWASLLQGKSGIERFAKLNPDHLPVSIGAEIKNFDPKKYIPDRKAIRLTYFSVHLALAAAKLAVEDSGIEVGDRVRIIREPYFGSFGTIQSLPVALETVDSGAKVRVAKVKITGERVVAVPRSNIEAVRK